MLTLKKCGSRIGKLLANQMQKADRFANKNMFLLAETGKGNRKTDSRCLELLSVFLYIGRRTAISTCVLLSILSGVLGGIPLTRWDFVRQNPYLAEDWHSQSGHREVIW
ncbi:hypothetical protein [Roseburia faecis]|nr:hypothetical protein [Roseburia faecis]